MATKRELLEALVPQTQTFADELDSKESPSEEDWKKLDDMVKDVQRLAGEVKSEGERTGTMSDAKAFLASLGGVAPDDKGKDTRIVTAAGLPMQPQGKTLGQMFVESGAYKDFTGRYGDSHGIIKDSIKGIQSGPFVAEGKGADRKALLTGLSDTSAGAMVRPTYYGPVTDLIGERELTVYDLVTKGDTDSDEIQYVRVTAKTNNAATVAEATSAAFQTYDPTTGAPILTVGGGYKPESSLALERVTTTVKTIAHWMPMTKRAVSDAGQVRTMVDTFLRYGLNEELEDQILSGGGTGEDFTGILSSSPQTVGSAGTDIDAVVDAIKAIRVTGRRRPNAMVIHPDDWYTTGFLLAKDTAGRYLVGDPRASIDQLNTLWGLQVVVSTGLAVGTALVGDFRWAVLWEREGINISVSDQHLDFFTRNLLAVLAEMRAGFGVLDPQAFCTITSV